VALAEIARAGEIFKEFWKIRSVRENLGKRTWADVGTANGGIS
jgi:hypothetical protein